MTAQQPRIYAKDREFLWKGQGTRTSYFIAQGEPEKVESFDTLNALAARLAKIPKPAKVDYASEPTGRVVSRGLAGLWIDSVRDLSEKEQHHVRMRAYDPTFESVSC